MTRATAPEPTTKTAPAEPAVPEALTVRRAAIWSVAAHLLVVIGAVAFTRLSAPPPAPPAYSVELVAAPAGPRALGAVTQGPSEAAPAQEPAPVTPPAPDPDAMAPRTPTPPRTPPPRTATRPPVVPGRTAPPRAGGAVATPGATPAGGGPTGGRGRDVANVRVQGIAFPFPGYLENITRQIALNFKPRPGGALRAEVAFLIHRDGSVSDLRLVSRSGVYAFDLECMGAVEAVGQRRSFGQLPNGFRDDVLPVVFSFDPSVLR